MGRSRYAADNVLEKQHLGVFTTSKPLKTGGLVGFRASSDDFRQLSYACSPWLYAVTTPSVRSRRCHWTTTPGQRQHWTTQNKALTSLVSYAFRVYPRKPLFTMPLVLCDQPAIGQAVLSLFLWSYSLFHSLHSVRSDSPRRGEPRERINLSRVPFQTR